MSEKPRVLIVGAGLAGLACGWYLHQSSVSFQILEASSSIGGRVKTDRIDGFLLDRGFQVLLTAYPEARKILDYHALSLNNFYPGAMIRLENRFHRVADPFRHPIDAFQNIQSPIGTLADKLRIARLRRRVLAGDLDDLFSRPETKTIDALKSDGFSDAMIDTFFRPFLGGVFLDPELQTTSRMLEFVFRMFSVGDSSLPEDGMGVIPEQIVAKLPLESLRLDAPVKKVAGTTVTLESGEQMTAGAVVLATDGYAASQLLGTASPRSRSVACIYFAADRPPINDPILLLSGDAKGPVNNLCIPSLVANSYAPPGAALISATVLQPEKYDASRIEEIVTEQLRSWFHSAVNNWQHLKTYRIRRALPDQSPPSMKGRDHRARSVDGLYICGDHTDTASINGALRSGRLTAQAIVRDLMPHLGAEGNTSLHRQDVWATI